MNNCPFKSFGQQSSIYLMSLWNFKITPLSISLLTKHLILSFSYDTSVKTTSFSANSTSINGLVTSLYIPFEISITGQSMVLWEAVKDKTASGRVFTLLAVTEESSGILTKLFAEFSWPREQCAEAAKSPKLVLYEGVPYWKPYSCGATLIPTSGLWVI